MYGNTSIWADIRNEFQRGNIITRLIFINIAVFLLINLSALLFKVFIGMPEVSTTILRQFTVPADVSKLVTRPWTLITHMFAHQGLLHILFNMLWLYWMGRILQEYLGDRKVLPLYVMGALFGAGAYILLYNVLPYFRPAVPVSEALGASAGVMAIVVGTATLLPDYRIGLLLIGPVKLKWLALVAVVLDVIGISGGNPGGSIAHLGGAFFGFLFIRQLQKGNDLSRGFNWLFDRLVRFFSLRRRGPRIHYSNPKVKAKTAAGNVGAKKQSTPGPAAKGDRQQRLDEILEKISRSGYDGLTKEEKDFLFRVSRED
jgi:membrane associated rhomboid family serine protease